MFNWLKRKDELDAEYMLPPPTRPAPQMPPVRNPAPIASEPVITLLEMLKRDEWEVQDWRELTACRSYNVINVYKEDVRFCLYWSSFYCGKGPTWTLLNNDWMTDSERELVTTALREVVEGINKLRAAEKIVYDRKAFAKLINVEI